VAAGARRRGPTPLDALALARRRWVAGQRIEIGPLAAELGIGRATLFRWVGSRELLHGEVIASFFAEAVARARRDARGGGPARVTAMTRRLLHLLHGAEPLRRFVKADPEYALRVLMSRGSRVGIRCAALLREVLEEEARAGRLRPPMELDALAYVMLRVGEAFLYSELLTGEPPDVEQAVTAISVLLGAPAGAPARAAAPPPGGPPWTSPSPRASRRSATSPAGSSRRR
jgi:AcrR family transcriptional regulator